MGSATLGKEHATVNAELCIGCGLCVTECPTGAMSLAKRQEPPHVCSSIKEMGIQVAKEKGKLDAFMKIMMK
jgi:Fe-S-cluster-containing hydrogenase component 2